LGIAEDSLTTFSTRILSVCFGIISSIILARVLGPGGKGAYALIILIPVLLTKVGDLGVGIANVYFIGKKKYNVSAIASNSLISAFVMGIILITFFLVLSGYLRNTFLKEINPTYLLIVACALPFALLVSYFGAILLGENKIWKFNLVNILHSGSLLGFLFILLLVVKGGLFGATLSWMLSVIVAATGCIFLVRKLAKINLFLNFKLFRDSIKFGVKGYLGNVVQLLNYRLDMFFVNFFLGVTFVGYYSIAVLLAETLWYLPGSVGTVLFPKVSSIKPDMANQLSPKICRNTLFITLLGSLLFFGLGKVVILAAFGARFLPALRPLQILLPGIVALSIPKVLSFDLTGRGKPLINTYAAAISLGINIPLNLLLIPKWGINGAAFASTVAYVVAAGIVLLAFLKISKNSLSDTIIIKTSDLKTYLYKFHKFRLFVQNQLKR